MCGRAARWGLVIVSASLFSMVLVCSKPHREVATSKVGAAPITEVTSLEQFTALVDTSGNKLLCFDLMAPWCGPCRMLAPILDQIAIANKGKVVVYRVNVDYVPLVADRYNVGSIPYVLFVKSGKTVTSLTGALPAGAYQEVIDRSVSQ